MSRAIYNCTLCADTVIANHRIKKEATTSEYRLPEDHDDPGEEVDVEEDAEEDGQRQEPVAVPSLHPALCVLKKLEVL